MFRRRSAGAPDGTAQESPGAQSPDSPASVKRERPAAEAAKGRPTPKRSEAERGRYQPIGSSRRSAGPRTAADKSRDRSDRSRKYDAMKRGEEWALNPRDKGPARKLARDYVDSHRRISEYYMYILVILVAALFAGKALQSYLSPLILVLVLIMAVEGSFVRRGLRKLMAERLPGESTRGLTSYAVMRMIQLRRFRMPAPQVKPGDKI
ncbi:MAG TPA: DUF3043 domain-containing protein [Streptosporangiaceae bacterium]